MAGNKIAGVDVLVKVDVNGTPTVVGGQSGATLNRETDIIEITSKDANGWTESIAGMKSWSIEMDGFLVVDDAGYQALEDAFNNRQPVSVEVAVGNSKYEGQAFISELPLEFPQDDAVTFSVSLTGTGALNKVAAV
jgi:TP901-1 family phage major tail protein